MPIRFYGALGNRCSVGNAVAQGVAALAAKRLPDEFLPRCATRDGVDAGEVFLGPGATPVAPPGAAMQEQGGGGPTVAPPGHEAGAGLLLYSLVGEAVACSTRDTEAILSHDYTEHSSSRPACHHRPGRDHLVVQSGPLLCNHSWCAPRGARRQQRRQAGVDDAGHRAGWPRSSGGLSSARSTASPTGGGSEPRT